MSIYSLVNTFFLNIVFLLEQLSLSSLSNSEVSFVSSFFQYFGHKRCSGIGRGEDKISHSVAQADFELMAELQLQTESLVLRRQELLALLKQND